jgi:hypothetical protein
MERVRLGGTPPFEVLALFVAYAPNKWKVGQFWCNSSSLAIAIILV